MLDLLYLDLMIEIIDKMCYHDIFSLSMTNKKIYNLFRENTIMGQINTQINLMIEFLTNQLKKNISNRLIFNELDLIQPKVFNLKIEKDFYDNWYKLTDRNIKISYSDFPRGEYRIYGRGDMHRFDENDHYILHLFKVLISKAIPITLNLKN